MDIDRTSDSMALVPLDTVDNEDSLQDAFLRMYKLKLKTDVKIILKHEEAVLRCFEAHKIILATRSPVFADLFCNKDNSCAKVVVFEGVTVRGLELLLWFIYSDELDAKTIDELVDVAKVSRRFQVGGLVRLCKRKLSNFPVSIDNVFDVLEASNYFKMSSKQDICINFINSYPQELIFKEPGFLKVSEESISLILKVRSTISGNEIHVLEGVIHWLSHRNPRGRKLLTDISFSSLSHEEFLDVIEMFPEFFTHRETTSILSNLLRPGFMDLPSWCQFSDYFSVHSKTYELIVSKSFQVKTNCVMPLRKFHLFGQRGFDESVTFEIKLSKQFPEQSYLAMLELAFGSSFVPEEHLEIDLFRFEDGSSLRKRLINFSLHITSDHYYIIPNKRLRVTRNYPFVFRLGLRVSGLRAWGTDAPVSNGKYRAVLVQEDIFHSMRLNVNGCNSVCLTPLSDWMLFLDPKSQEKSLVLTSFYFNS